MPGTDRFIRNNTTTRGVADYVFVYDITKDLERNRVDKVLKAYGFRVQKSVFECRLTKRLKTELLAKLEALQLQTGYIKMYKQEYSSKIRAVGNPIPPSKDEGYAFIV